MLEKTMKLLNMATSRCMRAQYSEFEWINLQIYTFILYGFHCIQLVALNKGTVSVTK